MKNNLQTVFADISDATISAINEVMPWVLQKISWFNFTSTITQKWESLQLPKRNDELYVLLRLVWTLPTVGVDSYYAAVMHIINEIKKYELSNSNLETFLSYLMNVWFSYPEKVLTWNILSDQQWIVELFNQNFSRVLNYSQNQTLKQFIINIPVMLKETIKTLSQPEFTGNRSQVTVDEIPEKIVQFIHKLNNQISDEKLSIKFFFDEMIKNTLIQDTIEIASSRHPSVQVQSDIVNERTQMSSNIGNNVVAVESVISSQLRSESTTSLETGLTDNNSINENPSIVIHDDDSETEEPGSSMNTPLDDQIIVISDDEVSENNSTERENSHIEVPSLDTVIAMDEFPTLI
ncbi:uncharacterized protein LOC123273904 [Cotesia glomerata]|uniref:uncharacterized protein LOC123273904 n=1 Tax=Cotesia glomerata TaxID=32391 RepID=UPI001D0345CB|nr:uncharacterized protein LOC123273904 [Cotesia glomerata]